MATDEKELDDLVSEERASAWAASDLREARRSIMPRIRQGATLSAQRDWMHLERLRAAGDLTAHVADNGQLEYLHNGKPVRVGP